MYLSTLFSNTLSLCSSLNVSDQVSHPYNTTVPYILIYFWTADRKPKYSTEATKVTVKFTLEQATKAQRGRRGNVLLFLQPRR
jgi:protocatechuate 3,4-dioxygenase beta subunit